MLIVHPAGFVGQPGLPNLLFRNRGDGTFERITDSPVVIGLAPYTVGSWADFDQDGDQDLFIGSGPADGTTARDFLYRNQLKETGTATFERITETPLGTDQVDGQVWQWIDYDNDGDLDAYLTNFWGGVNGGMRNTLYRNNGSTFTRVTTGPLVTEAGFSLAQLWGDYDNDGDLDLIVSNDGSTNRYYQNQGDGTFARQFVGALGLGSARNWGGAAGDYDGDGDLDVFLPVVFGQTQAAGSLYRNDLDNDNHWLALDLVGTTSNRAAIGARVRAWATINGQAVAQIRDVSSQNTFCGQHSLTVHFGFGDATLIDSVRVEWPSGIMDVLKDVAPDQRFSLQEGSSSTSIGEEEVGTSSRFMLAQNYPNPFNAGTQISFTLDQPSRVTLSVFDLRGRKVRGVLVDVRRAAGSHTVGVDGMGLPGGRYLYRLEAEEEAGARLRRVQTRTMTVLR